MLRGKLFTVGHLTDDRHGEDTMLKISRAGRKAMLVKALRRQYYQKKSRWMTVGEVAHRIGMKSSTNIKEMLWELVNEVDEIMYSQDDDATRFGYCPKTQSPLPERFITINGKTARMAEWAVADLEARKNAKN